MALSVYVTVDGTDEEIAAAVARVLAVRPRAVTDTRPPLVWLQDVLADVLDEYLRNAAAIAARRQLPALVRLATPPAPRPGPDWTTVSSVSTVSTASTAQGSGPAPV